MSAPNTNGGKAPPETPVVLLAINLTLRTVERRSRNYRNLVVAVTFTVMASILLGLFLRNWIALAGLIALPAWVVCFLFLDKRMVTAWRHGILQMQDQQALNVALLGRTLSGLQHLPQATLCSMMSSLTRDPKA